MAIFVQALGFPDAVVDPKTYSVTVLGTTYPSGRWKVEQTYWSEQLGASFGRAMESLAARIEPAEAKAYLLPVVQFTMDFLVVWGDPE